MRVGDLSNVKEYMKIEYLRHSMLETKNPLMVWIYYQLIKRIIQQVKNAHYKGER